MSMIKCSECGKEFSDKAPACPNCGCPTEEIKKIVDPESIHKDTTNQRTDDIIPEEQLKSDLLRKTDEQLLEEANDDQKNQYRRWKNSRRVAVGSWIVTAISWLVPFVTPMRDMTGVEAMHIFFPYLIFMFILAIVQDPSGTLKRMEDDGIKMYKIIDGAEQTVESKAENIVFRSDAPFKEFDQVMINGLVLDKKYYSVKKGSTIVTLNEDFAKEIPTGMHLFGIISKDGVAITTFTVKAKTAVDNDTDSPQTGDNSHMQYALGTASDAPVSGWSTAVPKAQIAGTYYVWYKVVGGANYKDTTPACVAVKIAKAAITVTADNKTKTYGDKDPAFTWRVTAGTVQPDDTLMGIRISRAEGENVDNYTLTVTHTAGIDPNYDITLVDGSLTVVKKEVGIRWDNTALIYNGSAQHPTATATGVVNGDQISFVISGAQTNASDTAYTAAVTDLVGAKAGNYKLPTNNTTKFTISKADQATPVGVGKIDETVSKKSDGAITGMTAAMEYRKAGESAYISVSESTVANLAAGTYYVRMKGDKNHKPSAEIAVTIAVGRKLNIRVPAQQTGYTLTSSAYAVDYLGGANLTFTLAEGYSKTENFAILLNGKSDAAWVNDRLSLQGIKDDLNITVDGVADITPPTAEIKVADNAWTSFLNNITFGLFFKETKNVTVTASDNGSGVDKIQYYVGEGQLEYDELRGIADWVDYNGGFALRPDNRYVVYVKVTDKAGNILYISSDGLVFDSVAPVFDGIENGGVYYGDKVIRVFDEHRPVALAVDGADVTDEIADDAYTIAADNQEHTLVATDKAGNVTEYRITVYKNYTVTFKIDGETVGTETVGHGKNATLPPIPEKEGYDQTAPVWDNDGKAITADTRSMRCIRSTSTPSPLWMRTVFTRL